MESNEIEQNKLRLMRSFVETQDPNSKEVDDLILIRFLRVRKLDVNKASDSFLKYIKWRREVAPNGYISELQVLNELSQKKLFMQGFDKKRRPIAVVFYGRHAPIKGKESLDELKRFMVYFLDKLCARMPNDQDQFTCIGDLTGWGFSHFDFNGCVAILSILQDYFPERLGQEVDDQILKRFLHVRKLDVDRASDSFLKYLKWIRMVAPNGSISKVEIPNELAQNKIFVQGFDKKGRPIAVVFFGRHVATKGKESLDELKLKAQDHSVLELKGVSSLWCNVAMMHQINCSHQQSFNTP
ncbi:Patellin-5 [Thalictrum thalictroides]|uniref:Patellin-5 n=1 Tax=Thalictrum thalictroides TaxID=46969 RepID=A0A7J6V735_THATH|nr:Patellin-5 [Thalictrum thalictroides]